MRLLEYLPRVNEQPIRLVVFKLGRRLDFIKQSIFCTLVAMSYRVITDALVPVASRAWKVSPLRSIHIGTPIDCNRFSRDELCVLRYEKRDDFGDVVRLFQFT